ncbi:MAG: hypothetical protein AAF989_13200, partial [Planctomycetota bacterium]
SLDVDGGDELAFHARRVLTGFPWYGIDLDESNLPQEADRDAKVIDFNKGCYLGQETVARLDALGKVQRKLVTWGIGGGVPARNAKLMAGEKAVARLTSVAGVETVPEESLAIWKDRIDSLPFELTSIAIGFARRSHFEPGAVARENPDSGLPNERSTGIQGQVMEST